MFIYSPKERAQLGFTLCRKKHFSITFSLQFIYCISDYDSGASTIYTIVAPAPYIRQWRQHRIYDSGASTIYTIVAPTSYIR